MPNSNYRFFWWKTGFWFKRESLNVNFVGQTKKKGKQADISEFRAQLDALGLKIIQVTADGNCFFRSVFSVID